MSEITVGELLKDVPQRDAIHVAITPVVCAAEELVPGQRIGFVEKGDTEKVGSVGAVIGIVDPFLRSNVYLGQRFWMFLLPNAITSLRHDWTHPEFSAASSEQWLKQFASDLEVTYDQLMKGADGTIETGEPDYIWHDTPPRGRDFTEFWKHYEIVTGRTAPDHEALVFEGCC